MNLTEKKSWKIDGKIMKKWRKILWKIDEKINKKSDGKTKNVARFARVKELKSEQF